MATSSSSTTANNNSGGGKSANAVSGNEDGRYTVDIRLFLAFIVTSMAISFGIGVGLGPTATQLFQSSTLVVSTSTNGGLPKVTSVNMGTPLEKPQQQADDLHEPAGQVRDYVMGQG